MPVTVTMQRPSLLRRLSSVPEGGTSTCPHPPPPPPPSPDCEDHHMATMWPAHGRDHYRWHGHSLPMLRLPPSVRNEVVAVLGEFVGTYLFLFMAFAGTQIANTPNPAPGAPADIDSAARLILICLTFGLSLTANVWAFYRVTGGLFNPAVTLALWLVGGLSTVRAVLLVPTQLIAGIAAAGVVSCLYPGPMRVDTLLHGGTSISQGLFIEMFLTAQLIFVILMLAVEKQRATFLAPLGIGIVFFLTELSGVYFTGGSMNPARSLGPATVNHSFPHYFWIYWIGPLLGSLLACAFYVLLKMLHMYDSNPGQDSDGANKQKLKDADVEKLAGSDSDQGGVRSGSPSVHDAPETGREAEATTA